MRAPSCWAGRLAAGPGLAALPSLTACVTRSALPAFARLLLAPELLPLLRLSSRLLSLFLYNPVLPAISAARALCVLPLLHAPPRSPAESGPMIQARPF